MPEETIQIPVSQVKALAALHLNAKWLESYLEECKIPLTCTVTGFLYAVWELDKMPLLKVPVDASA